MGFATDGFRRAGEDTGSLLEFDRTSSILDDRIVEVFGH